MNRTRLLLTAAILALATACTPLQLAAWEQATGTDIAEPDEATLLALPDAPMNLDATHQIAADGTVIARRPAGPCSQWYELAMAAGFTPAQWPNVARIMYRESRCQPEAYNRSGASGLMQIMAMWADDCGGPRAALFDPAFNLRCAVWILHVQGWSAWAL